MIRIETERLLIRPFIRADLDAFMAYRNNADWMRYQGFKCQSRAAYEAALLGSPSLEEGMQLAIILKEGGRLVGDLYLRREADAFWLGYAVHPDCARRGYAREAAQAAIGWMRAQGGAAIRAGVLPENTPSIRLLKALGFRPMHREDAEMIYELDG